MQGKHQESHELFIYKTIEQLVPQSHILRQIDKVLDMRFVRELTEPFYCQNNGRPSIDPEIFLV